jgi:hypothetical protein
VSKIQLVDEEGFPLVVVVLDLHQPMPVPRLDGRRTCANCRQNWPCPTARLLHPEDGGQ